MNDVELVVRNGVVIDGTGATRRRADVGIAGDRVVAVGRAVGAREIDATDRIQGINRAGCGRARRE